MNYMLKKRVPRTGLEPARLAAHAPETCASTNSATWALIKHQLLNLSFVSICFERKTGLGPATPTLARLCATNWAISACFSTIGIFDGAWHKVNFLLSPVRKFRVFSTSLSIAGAKVMLFSELTKLFAFFFQKNFLFILFTPYPLPCTPYYIIMMCKYSDVFSHLIWRFRNHFVHLQIKRYRRLTWVGRILLFR